MEEIKTNDVIHVIYEREAYGYGLVFDSLGNLKGALTEPEVQAHRTHPHIIDPKAGASFRAPWQVHAINNFNRYFGRAFRPGSPLVDSRRSFQRHLKGLLPKRRKGRILDLGAGSGQYVDELSERRVSLDIGFPQDQKSSSWSPFVLASGAQTPFKSQSFSLILCLFVLEHVPCPEQVCREIARLLAPGGRAVVAVPSEGVARTLAAKFLGRSLPLTIHHLRSFGLISHEFVMSIRNLSKIFRHKGFSVEVYGIDGMLSNVSGKTVGRLLRSVFPVVGGGAQTVLSVRRK